VAVIERALLREIGRAKRSKPQLEGNWTLRQSNSKIHGTWSRIEAWFAACDPGGVCPLAQPASPAVLEVAEAAVGTRLPKDVRESYLLHNGSAGTWVLLDWALLSLAEMVKWYRAFNESFLRGYFSGPDFVSRPRDAIRKDWFHPSRIPVGSNENGDYVFTDLAPAKGGQKGQIIDFWHDGSGATNVLAPSFGDWLVTIADELESGRYIYDRRGGIRKRNKR
jgi:cell wall assembly regulator SMI1